MKVNPYSEMMQMVFDDLIEKMPLLKDLKITVMGQTYDINGAMALMAEMLGEPWSEISENTTLLNSQYDLVGASRWPSKANEVVVVVNENNKLMDYQLFMLGLKSTNDLQDAIGNSTAFSESKYSVDELLGREFKIMTNAAYLDKTEDGVWKMHDRRELKCSYIDERTVKFADGSDAVKVVGVVRPKKGVVATSINGVIGYPSSLTETLLVSSQNHPAVKKMTELYTEAKANKFNYYDSVIEFSNLGYVENSKLDIKVGDDIYVSDNGSAHVDLMRALGFVDLNYPQGIDFYCTRFESKDAIVKFIDEYQKKSGKKIKFSDSLSSMMSFVNTMTRTITGVLVAFAAISLVVSTIMIAIIIYTSVLERRKEIGVLRSIGARKKDISRVFLAESAILGAYSGIIGLVVSAVIAVIGSVVLSVVFGIKGLMTITWWHCFMMFMISVMLSMFAGFVPSRIASNKDPAIALRSE